MSIEPRDPWQGRPIEERLREALTALRSLREFVALAGAVLAGKEKTEAALREMDRIIGD